MTIMDVKAILFIAIGILGVFIDSICASIFGLNGVDRRRFLDMDARTRHKRNVTSYDHVSDENKTVDVVTLPDMTSVTSESLPQWKEDLLSGKYYGSKQYMQRTLYKDNPHREPTVCFNNVTEERLNKFYCPMENQNDTFLHCCGEHHKQTCCIQAEFDKEQASKQDKKHDINELDVVTGLSIAAAFVVSIMCCLFLYCCCCQRRPEIHDGIKLMWVRRSFGKELNRLEQPAYQDRMTVVNSITGIRESRNCSRQGSRNHSRQGSVRSNRSRAGSFKIGSRNPSAAPSPSVSRRASHDPGHTHGYVNPNHIGHKHHAAHGSSKHHLGGDLPRSDVVITVTTPSDEHGPTAPLLKTAQPEGSIIALDLCVM